MTYPPPSMPPPPQPTGGSLPENANLELEIDGPTKQRRVTVFFRGLLLIPQFVVLFFLGIAQFFVSIAGWFGALVTGRLPEWARRFTLNLLSYQTRVNAYAYLLVDRYPPFSFEGGDYPARIEVHSGRLNRWAVFFRFILIIPAAIVAAVLGAGWAASAFILWIVVLVAGRTPAPVFGATAAVLRYSVRYSSYSLLLTSAYPNPKSIFGEQRVDAKQQGVPQGTRPLVLTHGAVALTIIFLVLGVVGQIGNVAAQPDMPNHHNHAAALNR